MFAWYEPWQNRCPMFLLELMQINIRFIWSRKSTYRTFEEHYTNFENNIILFLQPLWLTNLKFSAAFMLTNLNTLMYLFIKSHNHLHIIHNRNYFLHLLICNSKLCKTYWRCETMYVYIVETTTKVLTVIKIIKRTLTFQLVTYAFWLMLTEKQTTLLNICNLYSGSRSGKSLFEGLLI